MNAPWDDIIGALRKLMAVLKMETNQTLTREQVRTHERPTGSALNSNDAERRIGTRRYNHIHIRPLERSTDALGAARTYQGHSGTPYRYRWSPGYITLSNRVGQLSTADCRIGGKPLPISEWIV